MQRYARYAEEQELSRRQAGIVVLSEPTLVLAAAAGAGWKFGIMIRNSLSIL